MAERDAAESGVLSLDGDEIRYASPVYGTWSLPVERLKLIGEYTNRDGPYVDDYFIVFAASLDECYEASFYATGRDEALAELGRRLGAKLELALCSSADFASRVIWPAELGDEPLLVFSPKAAKGVAGRIVKLLGLGAVEQDASPQVMARLRRGGEQA